MGETLTAIIAVCGLLVELSNLYDAARIERIRQREGRNGEFQIISQDSIANSVGRAIMLCFIIGYSVLAMQLPPPGPERRNILTYVTWGYPFLAFLKSYLAIRAYRSRQWLLKNR